MEFTVGVRWELTVGVLYGVHWGSSLRSSLRSSLGEFAKEFTKELTKELAGGSRWVPCALFVVAFVAFFLVHAVCDDAFWAHGDVFGARRSAVR